jgi:hypothetical protein
MREFDDYAINREGLHDALEADETLAEQAIRESTGWLSQPGTRAP